MHGRHPVGWLVDDVFADPKSLLMVVRALDEPLVRFELIDRPGRESHASESLAYARQTNHELHVLIGQCLAKSKLNDSTFYRCADSNSPVWNTPADLNTARLAYREVSIVD